MHTSSADLVRRLLPLLVLLTISVVAPSAAAQERPLVVIDAGHGGADPGAIGPAGTREKDVTLSIARELASLLRASPHLEVRMTRDRDTLVALRDRPLLANRWRGAATRAGRPALFISIHANAHRDPGARGTETYFLSEARTDEARRVAAMENAAQEYEPERPADHVLGFILNDLRQNLYLRDSSDWAAIVQARLAATQVAPDRGVKQAGFVVLQGAFMPAVLVEVAFISNRSEEALLSDPAAQRRVARELAAAVREFMEKIGNRE
ncbi:MAG: N-acetylmuramoyl-L-alanine amidase [Gemmatimonadetes bacterium]|nr:N-acetylmuramoyl-L-alanine amidase [Gemmatimonadota bacterium]